MTIFHTVAIETAEREFPGSEGSNPLVRAAFLAGAAHMFVRLTQYIPYDQLENIESLAEQDRIDEKEQR